MGSQEDNDANNSHSMQQQQQQHLHNDQVLGPTSVIDSGDFSTAVSNTNNSSSEDKISCDKTRVSISPHQIKEENQELSDSIENVIDVKDVEGKNVINSCDNNDIEVNLAERDSSHDAISRNQQSADDATAVITTTQPPNVTGDVDGSVDVDTASISSDLREIRSTLADAAREASELLQELGNRNQE